jgi:hypothetical protein
MLLILLDHKYFEFPNLFFLSDINFVSEANLRHDVGNNYSYQNKIILNSL